jgi:hypothetical protein
MGDELALADGGRIAIGVGEQFHDGLGPGAFDGVSHEKNQLQARHDGADIADAGGGQDAVSGGDFAFDFVATVLEIAAVGMERIIEEMLVEIMDFLGLLDEEGAGMGLEIFVQPGGAGFLGADA